MKLPDSGFNSVLDTLKARRSAKPKTDDVDTTVQKETTLATFGRQFKKTVNEAQGRHRLN